MQSLSCLVVLYFVRKMTGPRKIGHAKQPNNNKKEDPIPDESWQAVLYQVLKCNILRGLVMFLVYCGLAWLVRMTEDTDQGQAGEGENEYDLLGDDHNPACL